MIFLKKCLTWSITLVSLLFTFVPESTFKSLIISTTASCEVNIIVNRILVAIIIFVLVIILNIGYLIFRTQVCIQGKNYSIIVKYGDLLETNDCKKIIPFDECFTTKLGHEPAEIKPTSICGQYLMKNPIHDIQTLISNSQLKPMQNKSKYKSSTCYESGKLLPYGNDLLLAFAKLDEEGTARMSHDEFLNSLATLWTEIDKYYGQKNVCIPILGSGITRIGENTLTQQELLDIIISSYQLTSHKIKFPYKLHIICKKCDGFSLNKIHGNL